METVIVLMSTYNGGKYISTQINSILNQKDVNVELFIRDDGSNFETKKILKEFEVEKNISIEYGENIGYQNSFLKLLQDNYGSTDCYYCFSDQDDYWEPDKLVNGVRKISNNSNKPTLYFTGLKVTDEDLNYIQTKEMNKRKLTLGSTISRSNIPGCTMVFNSELAKHVIKFKDKELLQIGHDAWVQLICAAYDGKFYYGKKSHIKYRRLETSVTSTSKSILSIARDEIKRLKKHPNKAVLISKLIIENLDRNLSTTNAILLNQILNYQVGIRKKIELIRNHEKNTGNNVIDYYTNILIFLNKY